MKKKSNKINLIICAAAFVVLIVYMLFVDDPQAIIDAMSTINVGFLLIAALFMLVYWLLEGYSLHVIMKSIYPEQKFKNTMIVSIIGQYFNCITPFASGGQPIQAYYLMRYGAPLGSSMTALLSKFISYQLVLTLYSAVALFFRFNYFSDTGALITLTIIGFIINTVIILLLLMLAFFKKPSTKIAHFIVRLLGKIKIIKNVDEKLAFMDCELEKYYENFVFIKSRPLLIIRVCLITAVQLTFYFAISFVIYLGFGLTETDFMTIISCQAFVLMISSFIPLPGAMGAAESSYIMFFKGIFGPFVNMSTFIWRFLTFYFPIIVGLIVTFIVDRKEKHEVAEISSRNPNS